MTENNLLDYSFDEEGDGFGEPERSPEIVQEVGASLSLDVKAGLLLIGVGVLSIVVQLLGVEIPAFDGLGLSSSWMGLLSSFGLLVTGAPLLFWARFRNTLPGIKHDGIFFRSAQTAQALGWLAGILITGFYVVIYWYGEHLERAIKLVEPLAQALTGHAADKWFLYGTLYTGSVLVFGVRMLMKYRHNRYERLRTLSVMFFQLGFSFIIPGILKGLNQPDYYFTYFWPLKNYYLWPGSHGMDWTATDAAGAWGWAMLGFGALMTLIGTPVLTYLYGKRWYCSWVCGCGGLAETLGDPYRQLSNKSEKAWKIERISVHGVLLLIIVVTGMLWGNHVSGRELFGGATSTLEKFYGFAIGAAFSGVIGVGFYPLLGNRVWCRFGCPQAAILGLWQRLFSRFRITTNGGQCMSCGNCSTYCEMGIDVRAYAQQSLNIVRSSCVGCGVCAAVCPRGVLKLENGAPGDRYDGADTPLAGLIASLKETDIHTYKSWPPSS